MSKDGNRTPRVLVIALGEAAPDLVFKWARQGILPFLGELIRVGVSGTIVCPDPFITPQTWGSILTGTGPGHHGAFDFWQRRTDGRFQEIDSTHLKSPPFWHQIRAAGLRCGIVNLPLTYPPEDLPGFMIAGQDAPGAYRSIARPMDLFDQLVARFGPYPLKEIFPGGRCKDDYLNLFGSNTQRWSDILENLVGRSDWDFFMTFSSTTAMAQHYFWADMASNDPDNPFATVVQQAYVALDRMIGRLTEAAGPDTQVFVISECGAGPIRFGVEINNWLEQEGFLVHKQGLGPDSGVERRSLFAALRREAQARLPLSAQARLNRHLRPLNTWLENRIYGSDIDWSRTKAYARGKEGQIFINLKGRESHGVVAPGREYEQVRDRLIERLLTLKDPDDGKAAVTDAHRSEDYYDGPYVRLAPDVVVCWRNGEYMPNESGSRGRGVFVERWRNSMSWPTSGSHRAEGIFLAAGPGIRRGADLIGGGILDLAPTWLAALGLSPPESFQGRVLSKVFEPTAPTRITASTEVD